MAMTDLEISAKPWWQSRAVIGGLVSAVASLAHAVGYSVDEGVVTELTLSLISIVGAVVAVYGRITATRPIKREAR